MQYLPHLEVVEDSVITTLNDAKIRFSQGGYSAHDEMNIFSNPSFGKFSITHSLQGECRLDITDVMGNLVLTLNNQMSTVEVDQKLNTGLYFVTIMNKEKRITTTLIVR